MIQAPNLMLVCLNLADMIECASWALFVAVFTVTYSRTYPCQTVSADTCTLHDINRKTKDMKPQTTKNC